MRKKGTRRAGGTFGPQHFFNGIGGFHTPPSATSMTEANWCDFAFRRFFLPLLTSFIVDLNEAFSTLISLCLVFKS
jgi:hypothetical protein